MDDRSTVTAVDAKRAPNGDNGTTPPSPSVALARMDPADVETVFARVEQAIADLPNTVKAIERRDGLKAVEAAAAVLDRHDIRAAAARAVAEVEQWIAKRHPPRPVGRPPKTEGDENLGRRPTFSAGDGGAGEAADAVSAEELRDIRRAHPDPEDDAALQARMQRIEAAGKVVSRRSLREQVRRERQGASAEPAAQDAPSAEPPKDGACAPSAPADAAAAPLHGCAVEALREQVEEDSIDAVAVALHRADEALIAEVLGFGEWAVRPGGLVLVQCAVPAVAEVTSLAAEPDKNDNVWLDYESLLACVGSGTNWFPVLVFRRRDYDTDSAVEDDGDADSAVAGATLFRADTGSDAADAWRQVLGAWLAAGSEVWDPCCGSGQVLAGAAAAGMRIVGADADAANIAATRAALQAAAGVAPTQGVGRPDHVTR